MLIFFFRQKGQNLGLWLRWCLMLHHRSTPGANTSLKPPTWKDPGWYEEVVKRTGYHRQLTLSRWLPCAGVLVTAYAASHRWTCWMCRVRPRFHTNDFPQNLHGKRSARRLDARLECRLMCCLWLPQSANARPQRLHRNGFSPVWTRRCRSSPFFQRNRRPQSRHSNCFSSSWNREWIRRSQVRLNAFPQTSHWYGRWSMCARKCPSR